MPILHSKKTTKRGERVKNLPILRQKSKPHQKDTEKRAYLMVFCFVFLQDANTSGEETTDGAVEEIEGDAHSHPRGKPSYVPRGRGRGGPRGGFRGRFIRRGGGGTRYPSKHMPSKKAVMKK